MKPSALLPDSVAVITGGASGIGLAAAKRFAGMGFAVCIADLGAERLARAAAEIGGGEVMTSETDVSDPDALRKLEAAVATRFSGVDILMNNAGTAFGSTAFGPAETWRKVLEVNLMGIVNGAQIFGPGMVARGRPGLIVNTGSKQGITTPPGDPAYNVSKAGVKAFTEALQHELRNTAGCQISAHLLVPGYVFTGLTARGQTEKPGSAWTPEQTVGFMIESLERGDFYILCPDNDVPRSLDERRIAWAAGDLIENRPPLSRWHPDYADAFAAFLKDGK
jgi:NAD(P)-dependent dehydrogenase (short-subunit alcohol dehydrogenase family)